MNTATSSVKTRSRTRLERLRARRDPDGIDPFFKTAANPFTAIKGLFGGGRELATEAGGMKGIIGEGAEAVSAFKAPRSFASNMRGMAAPAWQQTKNVLNDVSRVPSTVRGVLHAAGNQVAPLTAAYAGWNAGGDVPGGQPAESSSLSLQHYFPTNNIGARVAGAGLGYLTANPTTRKLMTEGRYAGLTRPMATGFAGMTGGWMAGSAADAATTKYRDGQPLDTDMGQLGARVGLGAGLLGGYGRSLGELIGSKSMVPGGRLHNVLSHTNDAVHGFGMGSMAATPYAFVDNLADAKKAIRGTGEYAQTIEGVGGALNRDAGVMRNPNFRGPLRPDTVEVPRPWQQRVFGHNAATMATRAGQAAVLGPLAYTGGQAVANGISQYNKDPQQAGQNLTNSVFSSSPRIKKFVGGLMQPAVEMGTVETQAKSMQNIATTLGLPEEQSKQIYNSQHQAANFRQIKNNVLKNPTQALDYYKQMQSVLPPEMQNMVDRRTGELTVDPKEFAGQLEQMAQKLDQQSTQAITGAAMNKVYDSAGSFGPLLKGLVDGGTAGAPAAVSQFAKANPELTQKMVSEVVKTAGPSMLSGGIDAIANPILNLFSPDAANSMSGGQKAMMLGGILAMFTGILSGGGGMGLGSGMGISGLLMLIPMLWPMIQKMFSGNAAAAPPAG